jgi:hypothetical protein
MIDKTNSIRAAEPPAPRQESSLSRAEAEGKRDEFREAMRQDAEKSGLPGKSEGGSGSEAEVNGLAKAEVNGLTKAERKELAEAEVNGLPEAEGKELAEADRKLKTRDEKTDSTPPPLFSGDALLRGLGASYAPLETQAAAPSSAPGASSDAPALAADLAERILVNTDNRAAGGEVRITLKDSVLPDTEILLRQEGERLVVQLVSGNPASLDALRLAQEDLRSKLLALDRDASVDVLDSRNPEQGDGGHSGRRSRGLDYFSGSER